MCGRIMDGILPSHLASGQAVTPRRQVLTYAFNVRVKESTDRYNGHRIDGLSDGLIGILESEHLVRMLIEPIEPAAERGVDSALRPLSRDCSGDNLLCDRVLADIKKYLRP